MDTLKISFELTAGALCRSNIRGQLNNSKSKLQHWYPKCRVLLTEQNGFFETKFYFEATNLPESAKSELLAWKKKNDELCG